MRLPMMNKQPNNIVIKLPIEILNLIEAATVVAIECLLRAIKKAFVRHSLFYELILDIEH